MIRKPDRYRHTSVLLAVVSLAVVGCGDGPATTATLAELAADPRAYTGRQVRVSGVLQTYPDPQHYWIEDAQLNRVEVEFHEVLDPWVGQPVQVQGRFSYQLSAGRRIAVDRLDPLPRREAP